MDEFNPLVSIVIPVYNGGNFLSEAIDSALGQTYKNIEIIVVNDGSSDDGLTRKIALSYGDKIRFFEKDNGGCATALNYGIAQMRGQYFSWLSHDDKYLPEKVEHQINLLGKLENKRAIIYGGYLVIDKNSRPLYSVRPDRVLPPHKLNIPLLPLLRGLIHGCSLLVPVELFREVGKFDESLPSTQDYALWFDFFRVSSLYFQDRQLVLSRVHPEQGTHKIANHNAECNDLWAGFLRRLSDSEMTLMEGSPYRFLLKTAEFLETTPYSDAATLARRMADEALGKILISVVIPFYNRIEWVIDAIQSVQDQSHQNVEIILIDDGSTVDTLNLERFISRDLRIKLYKQSNAGPAVARNFGVGLAKGEYIAFLDSDDLFHKEKIATQVRYMEESEIRLSHTSYLRMDIEGKVFGRVSSGKFAKNVFPQIITSCPIAMPTVMAKSSLLKENKFPEHLHIGEDVCLWISLAAKDEWGGLDEPLSSIRIGPSTAAFDRTKQVVGLVGIAFFLLRDPVLSLYESQIKGLLGSATSLLLDTDNSLVSADRDNSLVSENNMGNKTVKVNLRHKFLRSLRDDGLSATLQRVRRYLGK